MTRHDDTLYVALMRDEVRGAIDTVGRSSLEEFAADRTGPHVVAYHFMRLATRPLKASLMVTAALVSGGAPARARGLRCDGT